MEIQIDKSVASNIRNAVEFKTTTNSSKLFSMLSSFLYSEKELAVLHELSSNAVDAHKMVGKEDVPIEITLPSSLSPNLIVRDFGPGLSHENVIRFLTTYGESNKQESNDFIGGYGIGSKSPAAVTDTWTIISRHAGKLTHYMIVISKTGVPALTTLREAECDDSGLEVIIPTLPAHAEVWRGAAQQAYQYYKVRPIINGNTVTFREKEYHHVHDLFRTAPTAYRYATSVIALSGNRGYKVDKDQLRQHLDKATLAMFSALYSMDIEFIFNIGELDLDLSREKLRYSKITLDALVERIKFVFDFLKTKINKELHGLTRIDYIAKASELFNIYTEGLFTFIQGNQYGIENRFHLSSLKIDLPDNHDIRIGFNGKISQLTHKFTCGRTHKVGYDRYDKKLSLNLGNTLFSNFKFILEDSRGLGNRVRHLTTDSDDVYIISTNFKFLPKDLHKYVAKGSKLPEAPKAAKVARAHKKAGPFFLLNGGRYKSISETAAKGLTNAAWTTIKTAASAVDNDNHQKVLDLKAMVPGIAIIGVKSGAPTFCKSVDEKLIDEINSHITQYENGELYQYYRSIYCEQCIVLGAKVKGFLPLTNDLVELSELACSIAGFSNTLTKEQTKVMTKYLTSHPKSHIIINIESLLKACKEKYPLLDFVSQYHFTTDFVSIVVDYVKLVNNSK